MAKNKKTDPANDKLQKRAQIAKKNLPGITNSDLADDVIKRLGRIAAPHPSGFKLYRRMPHWAPDQYMLPFPISSNPPGPILPSKPDTNGAPDATFTVPLYPEETLKYYSSNGKASRIPFQPDHHDKDTRWMLGSKKWKPKKRCPFDKLIKQLLNKIRIYNRTLYRLRRAHLEKEGNNDPMDPLPGDGGRAFRACDLEKSFINAQTKLLKFILDKESNPLPTIVDIVEVNGYIVSVRVVGSVIPNMLPDGKGRRTFDRQPAGSESSHVYISSRFGKA